MSSALVARTECPVCQGKDFEPIHQEPYTSEGLQAYLKHHYQGRADLPAEGLQYRLVRCRGCSFSFQLDVPGAELLARIYDHWIPELAREAVQASHSLHDYRYLAEQVQFVIQHFGLAPHQLKLHDFGFGWAEWARMAAAFGCQVSGSELSSVRMAHAKALGLKLIDSSALPPSSFHFINTEQVFEHVLEPLPLLRTLSNALLPRGLIKVSVPDAKRAIAKLRASGSLGSLKAADMMPLAPLEHINAFEYASLVRLGTQAGLRVKRPSFFKLYNAGSGWLEARQAARMLLRPWFRHQYPRSTFIYFERSH
jgi:hypothetical protein